MSQARQSRATEFRNLWLLGNAPSIEEFVANCGPLKPQQLAELIRVEQSQRWDVGERTNTEQYFALFPELQAHRESAMDLVFSEFLLRERAGLNPSVDEFARRFPSFDEEFRRQIEFHRAINASPSNAKPADRESVLPPFGAYKAGGVPQIPGYEIYGELGRGAIGVVYKARHVQLNRTVALKMLLAGHFASPTLFRRFLVEAEATARVQHPNIVQIFEVGQHEGRPFLVLEFVNGGTLTQWTRGQPLLPGNAAKLVKTLAGAVHFAHEQGVVHRDLKPGNVLVQQLAPPRDFSEVSPHLTEHADIRFPDADSCQRNETNVADTVESSAWPPADSSASREIHFKIADFGLAKVFAGNSDTDRVTATLSGDVLGTIAYMSPEQARGGSANVTGSTDIYSLGAILYELLTGRPPFVGVQPLELLGQVISDEPVRPSQLVRRVPKDIQTICLKCLEKAPNRRYGSAAHLAEDLGRFLADQPIIARHTSALERSWRWCRRHPIRSSVGASIAAALNLVVLVSIVYSVLLSRQLTLTDAAKSEEQTAKIQAWDQLWESKLSQADALRTSGQVGQRIDGLSAIDMAKKLGNSIQFSAGQIDRMRTATIACLALPDLRVVKVWQEDWDKPYFPLTTDLQLSMYAYPTVSDQVVVRRTTDGAVAVRIPDLDPGSKPLLSLGGTKLAIVSDVCRVFDLAKDTPERVFETATQGAWSFFPGDQQLLGTDGNGVLSLVDFEKRAVIKTFKTTKVPKEVAVSPDSKLASLLIDDSVKVIALDTGNVIFETSAPNEVGEKHFAWHPNSKILAVGPYLNDGVVLWEVGTGTRLTSFFHNAGEMNICFNSTGDLLLTYDAWSGSMFLWNVSSGDLELSKFGISLFAISADKTGGFRMLQLVKGSKNLSSVAIENSQIYQTLPLISNNAFIVSSSDLAFSADGQFLTIANNGSLQVFDSDRRTLLDYLVTGLCFVQFDSEGSLLTLNELGLNRWRCRQRSESNRPTDVSESRNLEFGPPQFIGMARAATGFDVSRDGNTIAVPDADGALIWSVDNPDPIRTSSSHPDIRDLSISADGRRLATGGWNGGKACIWDTQTGNLIHTIDEPNCCLVRYSPNGRWLVTNSNEVTIWDAESWLPVAKIHVPGQSVSGVCVCFSPDSSIIAVSDSIARIHLIDPADGSEIAILSEPNKRLVSRMTFSPNGNQLAALSGVAGLVHIWNLVAIRKQLRQRGLDWTTPPTTPQPNVLDRQPSEPIALNAKPIGTLRFVTDARFAQLEASEQVRRARVAATKYDLASARAATRRALELQPNDPAACNDLAWLLSTGPLSLRDPESAVELAYRAWQNESLDETQRAFYVNTLGVALYRAGKIQEAIKILEQSLAMQTPDNQSFDLYFLSMCSARMNDRKKARDYFERAESLVQQYTDKMSLDWRTELAQFALESRLLLDN